MTCCPALRLVGIALGLGDSLMCHNDRSPSLLENTHDIIAVLPADPFLRKRLAQLLLLLLEVIVIDAEIKARDSLERGHGHA